MDLFLEAFEKVDLTFANNYETLGKIIKFPLTNEQKLFLRNVNSSNNVIFKKNVRQVGISTIAMAFIINECINKNGFKVLIINTSGRLFDFSNKIMEHIRHNNFWEEIISSSRNKIVFRNGSEINFQSHDNRYDSVDLLFIDEGKTLDYEHLTVIHKKNIIVMDSFSYDIMNQHNIRNYPENFWTICEIA